MSSTDVFLKISGAIFGVDLEFTMQIAGGPISIRLAPDQPLDFQSLWNAISDKLDEYVGFGLPDLSGGPWGKLLTVPKQIDPVLWLSPSGGSNSSLSAYLELAFPDPLEIGGQWGTNPSIVLEPHIQVWSVYLGYDAGQGGLDLRAKISMLTSSATATVAGDKTQIVTYPFPVPAQPTSDGFKLHYIGLGQRVGPTVVVNDDDPMAAIFDQLENDLVGTDPTTILTTLAETFYQPDRGWFIAADLEFRGFRVRIIFNDPTLYGLEISVAMTPLTPFSGLLFEILYQKLGPNLGVYYGALTLPYFLRRIVLDGVILILPGFSIWVYTNGDFRINVGWPLGDSSIGIQVGILVGQAGFYFAKLRSSDNPGAQPSVSYNPILEFGIGLSVFVQESFNASIFSATLSVSLTATLQGLLAWAGDSGEISGPPDHYWFAGSAGLSVLIQGTVDFSIIKASVTISFTANVDVALETGYLTLIAVSAEVEVEVSIKVVFFTIHLSFSTGISKTFTIGSGSQAASVNGPLGPGLAIGGSQALSGLHARALAAVDRMIDRMGVRAAMPGGIRHALTSTTDPFDLFFVLQPTATYAGTPSIAVIASLFIELPEPGLPDPSPQNRTDFERLVISVVDWLLGMYPNGRLSTRFQAIVDALGSGSDVPFGSWTGYATSLKQFLYNSVSFRLREIDALSPQLPVTAAMFPMLEELQLSYTAQTGPQTIDFDAFNPTPLDYPTAVNLYYDEIAWSGASPPSMARLEQGLSSPESGPSMASYVFLDYFLMLARNAAGDLLKAANDYEGQATQDFLLKIEDHQLDPRPDQWEMVDLVTDFAARITGDDELAYLLTHFDYASAAGIGSRFMLSGLQLPKPADVPPNPTRENMASVPTDGLFNLTGQQFAAISGESQASAVLSLNPASGAPAGWLEFQSGSPGSVTCTLPIPASVPPMPSPSWPGGAVTTSDTIAIQLMPPLSASPAYYSLKNVTGWSTPTGFRSILAIPQPLASLVSMPADIQVRLSFDPPPSTNSQSGAQSSPVYLPGTAALLIGLSLSQVPATFGANVFSTGSPSTGSPAQPGMAQTYLKNVYQISGTDEATRDLIFQALQSDLTNAEIQLLYTPASRLSSPSVTVDLVSDNLAANVLIAKTNLSTLNQVAQVGFAFADMLSRLGDSPSDFAIIGDVQGFLRLVWEVSVVNAPGFFLYYVTEDGDGLPVDIFSDAGTSGGETAQFDILVRFALETDPIPLTPRDNCIVIDDIVPRNALYARVENGDGVALPQFAPTYPAGSIGFDITWSQPTVSPEPEIPVDQLYHLLQFQVACNNNYTGSVWSLPLGPQGNADRTGGTSVWNYSQVAPVSLFAASGSPPSFNRYAAIDLPGQFEFRLIDVYGNALPNQNAFPFTPFYQDPLVSIGQWPGVTTRYSFAPSGGSPGTLDTGNLVITALFDPDSVVPPIGSPAGSPASGADYSQQWQATLNRYLLIYDQLTDKNVTVSVETSLAGGAVGSNVETRAKLAHFAAAIMEQVQTAIVTSSPPSASPGGGAQQVPFTLIAPVPFAAIQALDTDIVPINVSITLSRTPTLVPPQVAADLPSSLLVRCLLQPDLQAPAGSPGGRDAVTLFAVDFERAFTGFDEADGIVKVAQRSGVASGTSAPSVDSLWAVRWSRTAGISVDLGDSLVYFALRPLSTSPMSVNVDGNAFNNVDIDAWAQQFLIEFDLFLGPQLAVAIAILDERNGTTYFDQLAAAKTTLAKYIPFGLEAVFLPQLGMGDLGVAQELFEAALLTSLGSAFTVTTIAQIPATVSVVGELGQTGSPAPPPTLFGSIVQPPLGSPGKVANPETSRQYNLSSGEVDLVTGPGWLTTLVTVVQPSMQAEIVLPLIYQVSYLQHDFLVSEGFDGYIPSSWLKFTLPGSGPLTMPITQSESAHIPVPLVFEPPTPSLADSTATAADFGSPTGSPESISQEIADALNWNYGAMVTHTWAMQDQLYLDVTYNQALQNRSFLTIDPRLGLLTSLGVFREWYAANSPQFGSIITDAYTQHGSPPGASQSSQDLISGFTVAATAVANAWKALYTELSAELAMTGSEEIKDSFYLFLEGSTANLYGRTGGLDGSPGFANPEFWPSVQANGLPLWQPQSEDAQPSGSPSGEWWVVSHTFAGPILPAFNQLQLQWGPLNLLSRQSATMDAWVVRNAELVPGIPVNPDFIYTTDVVRFPNPIIPLIHRASIPVITPAATLAQTLEQILLPITQPGSSLRPSLRMQAGYSFQVAAPPTGSALMSNMPILLADDVDLSEGTSPAMMVADQLAAQIAGWYMGINPSQSGPLLNLALTLFATVQDQRLPLVQIDRIPIDLSNVTPAWWTGPGS